MARTEHKYLISYEDKDALRQDIMMHMQYDAFSDCRPDKEYTVRSIYLDTPELTTYYEKLSGIKIRNKFRIRGYNELNDDSTVFVEIKRKEVQYVTKDRAPVLYSDLDHFLQSADLTKVKNHTAAYQERLVSAKNFFYYFLRDKLKPVINVVYEREAMECRYNSGLRITFDSNIRSSLTQSFDTLFDEMDMEVLFSHYFVLEIKYGMIYPSWLQKIITKYNIKKEAVSKYACSIDQHIYKKSFFHYI